MKTSEEINIILDEVGEICEKCRNGEDHETQRDLFERAVEILEQIQPGWFEVQLPSMLLKRTALVPAELQAKADFTLKKLRLVANKKVSRNRRQWYEDYKNGLITDAGLAAYAPLVAEAVAKWKNTKGLPLP